MCGGAIVLHMPVCLPEVAEEPRTGGKHCVGVVKNSSFSYVAAINCSKDAC